MFKKHSLSPSSLFNAKLFLVFLSCFVAVQLFASPLLNAQEKKSDGQRVTTEEACKKYKGDTKEFCKLANSVPAGPNSVQSPKKDYNKEEDKDASNFCNNIPSSTLKANGLSKPNKNQIEACETGYKNGHYAFYHPSKTDPVKKEKESWETGSLFDPEYDTKGDRCGNESSGSSVVTKFNLGCLGNNGPSDLGAIEDVLYALVRFLSVGVGIVIVISMIVAGLQYSSSEGSAETTQKAKNRIREAVIGLLIYLFAFSLVQYLVPGGAFKGMMIETNTINIVEKL